MDEKKIVFALILLFASPAFADQCSDACGPGCDAEKCLATSKLAGGCYFNGVECVMCRGETPVGFCEDYCVESCDANPCWVQDGCVWKDDRCLDAGIFKKNCKTLGCELGYNCMADGECIHKSVSIQGYCDEAYSEHGLAYPSASPEECTRIGDICDEIADRCEEMNPKSTFEDKRKNDCVLIRQMCLQCQGDCELRRNTAGLEGIIYGIAAGIAALSIIVNALSMLSSEDDAARNSSKKAIYYTLVALALLFAAVKFVSYIWLSFT